MAFRQRSRKNAAFPYTFYRPSKQITDILKTGDTVKLIFLGETEQEELEGERMWGEISKRHDDVFKGHLTNQPYHLKGLNIDLFREQFFHNFVTPL